MGLESYSILEQEARPLLLGAAREKRQYRMRIGAGGVCERGNSVVAPKGNKQHVGDRPGGTLRGDSFQDPNQDPPQGCLGLRPWDGRQVRGILHAARGPENIELLAGWGSAPQSVGAMSSATEGPCERVQRPIESPPNPASGLSPGAPHRRGGRTSAQECARSREGDKPPQSPFSPGPGKGTDPPA